MDCREIRPMLSAFHDNECTAAERAAVEAHLRGCPACARLLEDLERLDTQVKVPERGPGYWDSFNRRLDDRIKGQAAVPGKAISQPRQGWIRQQLRYLIPAAAAAALVVWIVRFSGIATYPPVSPEPRSVAGKKEPETARPPAAPAKKESEGARPAAAKPSPRRALPERPEAARERESAVGPAPGSEPIRVSPPEPARVPETSPAPPGAAMSKTAPRFRAMADGAEEGKRLGGAEDRRADALRQEAGKPEAASSGLSDSSCVDARRLASEGRFREAEASQRACLARDATPGAQEDGLILLAELLDRQARFDEADAVIEEARGRFPDSRALDHYRRQRPQVQSGELPFPVAPR